MKKVIFILSVLSILMIQGCGMEYSSGTRIGSPYKFSKKGWFCKTWEGTLKTGYFGKSREGVVTSEEFNFTVPSDEVAKKVEELMRKDVRVELTYSQKLFRMPCSADSSYWVTDIKEIN